MGRRPHTAQTIQQDQRLVMSAAMKRAFYILQLPLNELSEWIENELEQNPVLEVTRRRPSHDFSEEPSSESLFSYLSREIQLHFTDPKEHHLAVFIAGNLNDKGFLTLSGEEICLSQGVSEDLYQKVLHQFHQIEPVGLGAKDSQECLLLQLAAKGERNSNLYTIIAKYFDDLIHNRLGAIAKALRLSTKSIKDLVHKDLKQLDPFPGHRFKSIVPQQIIPDLILNKKEGTWSVEVDGDSLPTFELHPNYSDHIENSKHPREERDFVRRHLASGKWLQRTLDRRKQILTEVGSYLLKKQKAFFEGEKSCPVPLTRRELAKALGLSESTVTRAILHKHLSCPSGIFPLSHFFSHAIQTDSGEISKQKAKLVLQSLIEGENKESPLSDEALSNAMQSQGVPCARRTVSKYRRELNIGTCYARKEWS